MNKLCKIITVVALVMIVISITMTAQAYTNDNVIAYITKAHTVNGRTVQLSAKQRQSLTQYLQNNPVTDSEADEIIAKLDEAKAKIDNSGATNLSQLDQSIKAEVVSLVKSAGAIAGLDVQIDTVNEIVTIKDSNGNVIISASSYSEFTGKENGNKKGNQSNTSSSTQSGNSSTSTSNSTTGKKLVYTGKDYSVVIKIIIAIVAIAILGVILKNKYAK